MPIPELSVEEMASVLRRSSLFSVIVEGRDDIVAFRVLERRVHRQLSGDVYLISAGGRSKLLQLYNLIRDDPALEKCIFICDQDTWVLTGIPEEYNTPDLICTDGYSLENDLLRDYPPANFMEAPERDKYLEELNIITQWYSIEVFKHISGKESALSTYVGNILDGDCTTFAELIQADESIKAINVSIQAAPERLIRGKAYLQVAMRQLARKGRQIRHHDQQFLEHAANSEGYYFSRLYGAVQNKLNR